SQAGFRGGLVSRFRLGEDASKMARPKKYPTELRERAVRMCLESERPIAHVARDLGIHSESLRTWVRQAEADAAGPGASPARLTSDERDRLKQLERENRELKKANQILRDASVFFAKELDGTPRR
ncbi:transposase, partial [Patulibacter brassicae]